MSKSTTPRKRHSTSHSSLAGMLRSSIMGSFLDDSFVGANANYELVRTDEIEASDSMTSSTNHSSGWHSIPIEKSAIRKFKIYHTQ